MDDQVLNEICARSERAAAIFAHVRTSAGVHALVHGEIEFVFEFFAALFARILLHRIVVRVFEIVYAFQMVLQRATRGEYDETDFANASRVLRFDRLLFTLRTVRIRDRTKPHSLATEKSPTLTTLSSYQTSTTCVSKCSFNRSSFS